MVGCFVRPLHGATWPKPTLGEWISWCFGENTRFSECIAIFKAREASITRQGVLMEYPEVRSFVLPHESVWLPNKASRNSIARFDASGPEIRDRTPSTHIPLFHFLRPLLRATAFSNPIMQNIYHILKLSVLLEHMLQEGDCLPALDSKYSSLEPIP